MFHLELTMDQHPYAQILTTAAHYSFCGFPVYGVQNAVGTVESKEQKST